MTKEQAEAEIANGSSEEVCSAIVSVALHESDWQWAQERCFEVLAMNNDDVKRCALVGLGHIVRIHGRINLKKVQGFIEKLKSDERFYGPIDDLLSDINVYHDRLSDRSS